MICKNWRSLSNKLLDVAAPKGIAKAFSVPPLLVHTVQTSAHRMAP